jgi:hypothetical protein
MTRTGAGLPAPSGAVSALVSRADTCIRAAAGVTVARLAGIAGRRLVLTGQAPADAPDRLEPMPWGSPARPWWNC